jgi:hypothetical protein
MNDTEQLSEPASSEALQVASLEQRVQRLEDAVAQLQDTRPLEDRVVERIEKQVNRGRSLPVVDTTGMVIEAGRRLLPFVTASPPTEGSEPAGNAASTRPWLVWDLFADLRAMLSMFVDPRYKLGWVTRIVPLVLLVAIATSSFWPPMSMLPESIRWIPDKVVDLIFAYVLWKILIHEARRYRQTAPDLPAKMRL